MFANLCVRVLCAKAILALVSEHPKSKFARMMVGAQRYSTQQFGSLFGSDFRLYIKDAKGTFISPWHDIPLWADQTSKLYNMVVEIPRWSNAKMEMSTKEPMTPIKQDAEKDGRPRFIGNIFPYHGYIWNYGALPQTWENPKHVDAETGAAGDNDPIDVMEIGERVQQRGSVIAVKIVGVIAMIDSGEMDWKLLAINVNDSKSHLIKTLNDVEVHFPGLLSATREWLRCYKVPSGKPTNRFGLNERFLDSKFAENIIAETHGFWKQLIADGSKDLNTETSAKHLGKVANPAKPEDWARIIERQPASGEARTVPDKVDKWHFLD